MKLRTWVQYATAVVVTCLLLLAEVVTPRGVLPITEAPSFAANKSFDIGVKLIVLYPSTQYEREKSMQVTFVLVNLADSPRLLTFKSSVRFDFVVFNHALPNAYKWSSGKLFNDTDTRLILNPGQDFRQTISWIVDLPVGVYELDGYTHALFVGRDELPLFLDSKGFFSVV